MVAWSPRFAVGGFFDDLTWTRAFVGVRLEAAGAATLFGAGFVVTLDAPLTGALTRLVAAAFAFVRDVVTVDGFGFAEPARAAGTELFDDLGIVEFRIV